MALYASDRPDQAAGQKIELTAEEAQRLALAVIGQALRDARSADRLKVYEREHARTWLRSDGATWLQSLGKRITQADLERWLSGGCPNWGSTRTI